MTSRTLTVHRPDATLQVHLYGNPTGPAILFNHSILASSTLWAGQVALLVDQGWHLVCIDTRGHGGSHTSTPDATMATLVADTIAVLDNLKIAKAHYVGLSLGGMSGFGLALAHADRLQSLFLCAARADAPPAMAQPWEERIAVAEAANSCEPLAQPTIDRWFGRPFLDAHPETERQMLDVTSATTVTGFVACARAIQSLDWLDQVHSITLPTTLLVGSNDGMLPAAMSDIAQRIRGSVLDTLKDAGHIPNVHLPDAFNVALLRHLSRAVGTPHS